MEHVIYSHVISYLTDHHLIGTNQHGFRKGFSCERNFLNLLLVCTKTSTLPDQLMPHLLILPKPLTSYLNNACCTSSLNSTFILLSYNELSLLLKVVNILQMSERVTFLIISKVRSPSGQRIGSAFISHLHKRPAS